jgi:hypothetical protein
VIDEQGEVIPLPTPIAKGVKDVGQREGWNRAAETEFALPTETWREHVARRDRCLEVREKLAVGEIHQINDLITYNLDIRQFAQDAITTCEGPDLLRAFYTTLAGRVPEKSNEHFEPGISVLDPTCGSGAFLFAALNILEPLYEACLTRMRAFVDDMDNSGEPHSPQKYADFRRILADVEKHPNARYFILKSIIVNNLYGVDIMEEAVEICKLRLFLKLVAQVDKVKELEPLPDIDFNIRAGNTLVGYAALDDVKRTLKGMLADEELRGKVDRIAEDAEVTERAFEKFHEMQTGLGIDAREFALAKGALRERLKRLSARLDNFLAEDYGIEAKDRSAFENWKKGHKPFHWFAEFYGIVSSGGFDAIIGNPPYVELKEVPHYRTLGYKCQPAGNLYPLVLERSTLLVSRNGRQGFIVPVSSVSTDRYKSLQELLCARDLWYSSYDDRPSRLFDGLEHIRLTIHLIGKPRTGAFSYSTKYHKWTSVERSHLFTQLTYVLGCGAVVENSLPKLTSSVETGIIDKLTHQKTRLQAHFAKRGSHKIFYSRKVGYFLQAVSFQPKVLDGKGRPRPPSEFKELVFNDKRDAQTALCCLNSSLFYWFVTAFSDCRHVNKREVDAFPINLSAVSEGKLSDTLVSLAGKLMEELKRNSVERQMNFKHDSLTVQCIIPKLSKTLIDRIDQAFASHYGFSEEELDFIVNYDIKYRMGQDDNDSDDA